MGVASMNEDLEDDYNEKMADREEAPPPPPPDPEPPPPPSSDK
jgi:hypothetical protein